MLELKLIFPALYFLLNFGGGLVPPRSLIVEALLDKLLIFGESRKLDAYILTCRQQLL